RLPRPRRADLRLRGKHRARDPRRGRREDHHRRASLGIHPGEGRLIAQPQSAVPLAQSLQQLQQKIGIHFRDPGLLLEAVTHSSFANAFEAVLGAVFLDAGYDAAYHYYLNRYRALPSPVRDENFKGRLQQVAQERFGETPVYDSEGARVGQHREYTSVVFAGAQPL